MLRRATSQGFTLNLILLKIARSQGFISSQIVEKLDKRFKSAKTIARSS